MACRVGVRGCVEAMVAGPAPRGPCRPDARRPDDARHALPFENALLTLQIGPER